MSVTVQANNPETGDEYFFVDSKDVEYVNWNCKEHLIDFSTNQLIKIVEYMEINSISKVVYTVTYYHTNDDDEKGILLIQGVTGKNNLLVSNLKHRQIIFDILNRIS